MKSRRNGCASAAIGIRAAAFRSTCFTRPAYRPRGCGCPTRESRPIVAEAEGSALKTALIAEARSLGFDAVRVTRADLAEEISTGFDGYIAAGNHGDMDWLAREPERRRHPKGLWPEARSVIVLGMNYGPDTDPLEALAYKDHAAVAAYALGKDYHDIIKKRLKELGRWLGEV